MKAREAGQFVLCLRDGGYPESLEIRKVYRVLPDTEAVSLGLIRVVDESGEDYLYPRKFFVSVELPLSIRRAILLAA